MGPGRGRCVFSAAPIILPAGTTLAHLKDTEGDKVQVAGEIKPPGASEGRRNGRCRPRGNPLVEKSRFALMGGVFTVCLRVGSLSA